MIRRTVPAATTAFWFLVAVAAARLSYTSDSGDDHLLCAPNDLPDPQTLRSDQLTVLINGYSEARLPLLRSIVETYSSLPFVAAVLVLWGNPSVPSRSLEVLHSAGAGGAPISVLRQPTSSLNARFLPRPEIRTRAVAVCDDDVEIDQASLRLAFHVWGTHHDRIVGFFARSHDLDLSQRSWMYTVHPDRYSIMLTKFMILGTEYLYRYSCGGGKRMRAARAVVDSERNCEDILMNFVVAMETGSGPLLVGGRRVRDLGDVRNEEGTGVKNKPLTGIGAVGLSAKGDHRKRRGDCIREFHRTLGVMPLRYSYGKVVKGVGEQALCKKAGKLVLCDAQ
ncbi:unnamed protein product [Spirodela intermedia]|uniref:Glycosyl transferase 64 domain-containing protein n=1 Tax=Spirodela intermedia TaxID=51605 RepID=A0A7I8JQ85_SPIIN|nr:unnamed protein product [Spirodela intermedia]CAA6671723.1 unnamed protein product [Spirodela intermedia]